MSAGQVAVTVSTLATVAAYAVLAGRWVCADPGWYSGLRKPAWQPPPWVFGVAWPAAVALGGAALLTWLLVGVAGSALVWAGWLLVPYAGWLTVAAALSVGYWRPARAVA